MPRKKIARVEEPVEELRIDDLETEPEGDELTNAEIPHHECNRGLDIYSEDGELVEAAEPTYFEDEEEEE